MMNHSPRLITEVQTIYQWLEEQLSTLNQPCRACGDCCDFESFGHRLYVTTPELVFFHHFLGPKIREMVTGVCPYRVDGKCSAYPYRFAGCRIFSCKGEAEKENAICEQAVSKFKALCEKHGITYRYVYIKAGLDLLIKKTEFETKN